jgi:hypothetical protein
LWLSAQLAADGLRGGRVLALALCLAGALLSKLNALALLPVAGFGVVVSLAPAIQRARERGPRLWMPLLVLVGLVTGALALLARFPTVTGHLFQLLVFTQFLSRLREPSQSLSLAFTALPTTLTTLFASFGWGKVNPPGWLYTAGGVALGFGLLGLAASLLPRWRRQEPRPARRVLVTLGLAVLCQLASILALVITYQQVDLAPGRYLLPALAAICILLVEGWRVLLPRRVQVYAWRALAVGVAGLGWLIPLALLIPTYALPRPFHGQVEQPAIYAFGPAIHLTGFWTPGDFVPGQANAVRLCWQATAPVQPNYTLLLEVIGPDGGRYGYLPTYHGHGNFPTRFWLPGQTLCERYQVPVVPDAPAPAQAWVHVSLLDPPDLATGERLPVVGPDGRRGALDAFVLPVRLEGQPPALPPALPLDDRFGDALRLTGYSLALEPAARRVQVTLQWQALRDLTDGYTVFVHLRDTPTTAYAQSDSAPRNGWYPTHLWRRGEVVDDVHTLTLPAGAAPPLALYLGVVDPAANARLPAVDSAGQRLPNDELLLVSGWTLGDHWALPAPVSPPGFAAP